MYHYSYISLKLSNWIDQCSDYFFFFLKINATIEANEEEIEKFKNSFDIYLNNLSMDGADEQVVFETLKKLGSIVCSDKVNANGL